MSFAEEVKNEIAHCKPENDACRFAELAALLCMGGSLILGSHGTIGIEFSTSNNAVARKALKMWMESFPVRPEVRVRQGLRLRKKNYYILRVTPSPESTAILRDLSLFPTDTEFSAIDLRKADCQRAFLRGAFMGGGSVNQPKGDYHLELVTGNAAFAEKLLKIMRRFHLPAKTTDRKGDYLVYVKEGNGVSQFLQYIGADQAYLKFESVRVVKGMRNNVNRVVNCETANLQKTVDAAVRQRRAITCIQESGLYQHMSPKLREAAELRMANPEASMSELAAQSGLTKSGLSHRFKKIADIAKQIEGQKKMKFKKLCTYIAGLLTACLPLAGALAADLPAVDDPDVMDRVVAQRMLPISMTAPVDTGTLLLSDSPEYADGDGILYGDTVSGDVRLYFYHVNQHPYNRKIVAMLYNPHPYPLEAVLQGYQYTRPSTDYYQVGKELSTMYYEGNMTVNKITVPAHDYAIVGRRLNETVVRPDQLFSGIVNVSLPEPMILSSMILPPQEDPIAFIRKQQYLASDSVKLRGTFHGKDRYLSTLIPYSTDSGIGYILLADGVWDRFLQGRDVMDNRTSEDTGNYGVDYTIHLRTTGTGNIHLYFNPQGGEYAGVTELIYSDPQRGEDKKIVELPRHRHSMGLNDPYAMEYVDTFPAGTDMTIRIMPPGAANLPVRFLVVPDDKLQPIREAVQADRTAQEQRAAAAAEAARRKAAHKDTTIQPEAELQSDNQGEFTSLKDRLAKLQKK